MPIDTPYNRMVTNEYNQLLRNKVAHEESTYQTVMPSPAGMYVNGYEPVMMGSGVGLYKKSKACPKGHAVCSCPSGTGISATICGSGRAHGAGEYDRVVGGMNRGLEPTVRVEMALGAGMRGDATSKHGCLDMYEKYAHNNNALTEMRNHNWIMASENEIEGGRRHGNKGQAYNRLLASEHGNKNKALRQLGNGSAHGRRKKGNKSPISSDPKKEEKKKESIYTLDNLVKGFETAEKVGNAVEKVANLGSKAWSGVKGMFGKGSAHGKAHGKAHGSAHGKAHGKSRSEIVKDIMKKMGMAMCDASKYVKEHGLY